ncbi:MucR family transcriptional regulator [Methylobacterium oryzae CBMB20]
MDLIVYSPRPLAILAGLCAHMGGQIGAKDMDAIVEMIEPPGIAYTELTTGLVSAFVSNNPVPVSDLPALIASTHAALTGLGQGAATKAPATQKLTPAQIRKSITPGALISFIDGKPYKTLKRHLSTHGMTIEEYRQRYGPPRDYPSTAASYSAQRSALAKSLGLGNQRRKAAPKAAAVTEIITETPKSAGARRAPEAARRRGGPAGSAARAETGPAPACGFRDRALPPADCETPI